MSVRVEGAPRLLRPPRVTASSRLQRGAGAPGGVRPPNHEGWETRGRRGLGAALLSCSCRRTPPAALPGARAESPAWVNLLGQLVFAEHLCGRRLQALATLDSEGREGPSHAGRCGTRSCPNRRPRTGRRQQRSLPSQFRRLEAEIQAGPCPLGGSFWPRPPPGAQASLGFLCPSTAASVLTRPLPR